MRQKIILTLILTLPFTLTSHAQAVWTSAGIDFKIYKQLSGYVEAEYRTHNKLQSTERWAGAIGLDYKPIKYLKTTIGYNYIHDHSLEETTKKGNIVPPYWLPKHRANVSVTGMYEWKGLKVSLRERYQYTFNNEKYVEKLDGDTREPIIDDITGEVRQELVKKKHKHVMRTRLEIEYEIPKIRLTPYIAAEMYNLPTKRYAIDKMRYTAGLSYPITKKHSIKLYYLFEDHNDYGEINNHVIGIGYKFKIKGKKNK